MLPLMKRLATVLLCACLLDLGARTSTNVPPPVVDLPPLTQESASNFAKITLACVSKEYPNQPAYILNDVEDVQAPSRVHPAFYGCYDWHSSVHGHWMLARVLRLFPSLPEREQIIKALDANLTKGTSRSRPRISNARARRPSSECTGGPGR